MDTQANTPNTQVQDLATSAASNGGSQTTPAKVGLDYYKNKAAARGGVRVLPFGSYAETIDSGLVVLFGQKRDAQGGFEPETAKYQGTSYVKATGRMIEKDGVPARLYDSAVTACLQDSPETFAKVFKEENGEVRLTGVSFGIVPGIGRGAAPRIFTDAAEFSDARDLYEAAQKGAVTA